MKNLIKLVINLTVFCLIFLNSNLLFSQESKSIFTVVLDAGHGGKDPGNRGNGYYEKNIALSIALKVGEPLKFIIKPILRLSISETNFFKLV